MTCDLCSVHFTCTTSASPTFPLPPPPCPPSPPKKLLVHLLQPKASLQLSIAAVVLVMQDCCFRLQLAGKRKGTQIACLALILFLVVVNVALYSRTQTQIEQVDKLKKELSKRLADRPQEVQAPPLDLRPPAVPVLQPPVVVPLAQAVAPLAPPNVRLSQPSVAPDMKALDRALIDALSSMASACSATTTCYPHCDTPAPPAQARLDAARRFQEVHVSHVTYHVSHATRHACSTWHRALQLHAAHCVAGRQGVPAGHSRRWHASSACVPAACAALRQGGGGRQVLQPDRRGRHFIVGAPCNHTPARCSSRFAAFVTCHTGTYSPRLEPPAAEPWRFAAGTGTRTTWPTLLCCMGGRSS